MRARDEQQEQHPAQPARPPAATGPAAALQRSLGNAAVVQLMESDRHVHDQSCGHSSGATPVQRSAVEGVLGSSGGSLPQTIQAKYQGHYGVDLSSVRVHTGPTAKAAADSVGASAFTSGRDIVFGSASPTDEHVVNHELKHVEQQAAGPVAGTDNGSGLRVSDPSDRFEREAESHAQRVVSAPVQRVGGSTATAPAPGGRPATPAGARGIQRAGGRSVNPHVDGKQTHDNWELTAHHIIPHSTLTKALDQLSPADREAILIEAVPDTLTSAMLGRLGAKGNPETIRKKLTNPAMAGDQECAPGVTCEEARLAFFEWQGGNQFLGPNTSIRAEPGKNKDDIDTDGRYFVPPTAPALRQQFDRLVALGGDLKQATRENGPDQGASVAAILREVLPLTKNAVPAGFDLENWTEITDPERVEELAEHQGLNRGHLKQYAFFKIASAEIEQVCPKILRKDGTFFEREGSGDSDFNWSTHDGEAKKPIHPSLLQVKGTFTYLNVNTVASSHPDLYRFLQRRKVSTSTYLPKQLYSALNDR
ncbi:DUF4157 domain-containing protein [Streptomyces sp. LARHCF249]